MSRYKQYDGLGDDLIAECNRCKVPDDCNPRNKLCGISRGIKYGIYPKSAMNAPQSYLNQRLISQLKYGLGFKEQPLWRQKEGMSDFVKDVARYSEPWMDHESWSLT